RQSTPLTIPQTRRQMKENVVHKATANQPCSLHIGVIVVIGPRPSAASIKASNSANARRLYSTGSYSAAGEYRSTKFVIARAISQASYPTTGPSPASQASIQPATGVVNTGTFKVIASNITMG